MAYLRVPCVDVHDRYLGFLVVLGCKRSECFAHIKDRLWKKLKGWRDKILSAVGKEVLIKVVRQSLPTYSMNFFLLSKAFCEDLQRILYRFWWGDNKSSRRIYWLSWDTMCLPKKEEGLGFRSLFEFNLALLAKQGWRLIQNPSSLASCFLKAKYFPHNTFWISHLGTSPSGCWRVVLVGGWGMEGLFVSGRTDGSIVFIYFDHFLHPLIIVMSNGYHI